MPARNAAHGLLGRALSRCRDERATGVLHVQGSPGGAFHLLDGAVVAVESPGAPGVGTLLVRSGRIDADEWNAAHDAAATGLLPGAAIAAGGRLGTAEFQVLHMMAVQDAVFAVLAGRLDNCAFDPDAPGARPAALPQGLAPGVEPEELLVEAGRRLAALASLPRRVSPDRDRVTAVGPPAWADEPLAPVRREILGCANGRRSPRDIAFLIGRGVYTITVEVARMCAEGLVETVPAPLAPAQPPPVADSAAPVADPAPPPPSRSPRPPRSRRDPPRRALPSLPGRTSRTRARTRTRRNGSRGRPPARPRPPRACPAANRAPAVFARHSTPAARNRAGKDFSGREDGAGPIPRDRNPRGPTQHRPKGIQGGARA
ncbi:MarR family transcriptional regulator [Actinacidiphila glaucinigra]|uniref:MarR family transcriptional regulator n=1 Tax=Actinacidiphila glaucinigra TaxID=235986 RepID=UPI003D92A077